MKKTIVLMSVLSSTTTFESTFKNVKSLTNPHLNSARVGYFKG